MERILALASCELTGDAAHSDKLMQYTTPEHATAEHVSKTPKPRVPESLANIVLIP